MKRFLVLFFVTATAQAACDYTITENRNLSAAERNKILCDINFKCAEKAIRDVNSDPSELETLGDYGRSHNCNDELRLAALFESLDNELFDPALEEPSVDNSERGNTKTDLPVIQDAPSSEATRTSRQ